MSGSGPNGRAGSRGGIDLVAKERSEGHCAIRKEVLYI